MLLEARSLGRRLGTAWIWRGLDVRLEAADSLAVVGPTGAGKSLLLRCLSGLDAADEGELFLDGTPFGAWPTPAYRARVVYLHQRPALNEGTVEDNIRGPLRLAAHRGRPYSRPAVLDWLAAFEREAPFLGKTSAELSGGEAQIVALIRALCIEPSVLLLDEPSASMDAGATLQAETLLLRWAEDAPGRATVWTSHSAGQIERVAARTMHLGGGPEKP